MFINQYHTHFKRFTWNKAICNPPILMNKSYCVGMARVIWWFSLFPSTSSFITCSRRYVTYRPIWMVLNRQRREKDFDARRIPRFKWGKWTRLLGWSICGRNAFASITYDCVSFLHIFTKIIFFFIEIRNPPTAKMCRWIPNFWFVEIDTVQIHNWRCLWCQIKIEANCEDSERNRKKIPGKKW